MCLQQALLCSLILSGCASAPPYEPPAVEMPAAWALEAPWRAAQPADTLSKGPWWQRFDDAQLNALQDRALANSTTLALATARLAQARATMAATSAGLLPQLGLTARPQRQRISANRPLTSYSGTNVSTVQNDFIVAMAVSYEVDLAGRVQNAVSGAVATAEQSAADFENMRLVLTADLATAYFNLRALDSELDVLSRSIALQRRSLDLVNARHELGAATGLDVAQQQALLDTTLVQVDVLRRQRGQFEHAIATLSGTPAPSFSLPPQMSGMTAPVVPLGLPSDILQRRPDVASAERAMAAANAQIGVARAAFFPSINLGASFGNESRALASLFDAPSLLWQLGVSATQMLFDGGRTQANADAAQAGYEATAANYRRVVLVAMQEVEDGISGLSALDSAAAQAQVAVATARSVLDMQTARYEGGASAYQDLIVAQQALLASERQATQLLGQRLVTSVFLVKALGGDWGGWPAASSTRPLGSATP